MLFTEFPRFTKGRVDRAADRIRNDAATAEDEVIVENWRASHGYVLNTFQATLRRYARNTDVTVAQRLKRRKTIYDKFTRYPRMQLTRMNYIAGCRIICDGVEQLQDIRHRIKSSRFKHKLQNQDDDYDYIKSAKPSGYRGVHDVYRYVSFDNRAQNWNGLLVELQYRTRVQHAWATAVEVAGSVTGNQPKFDRGDANHIRFFKLASEILARHYEEGTACCPELNSKELLAEFKDIESRTHILAILSSIQANRVHFSMKNNVIIMLGKNMDAEIFSFRRSREAIERYFELEEENEDSDIVLVRGDSSEAIKNAFRNYFQDTDEFVSLIKAAT